MDITDKTREEVSRRVARLRDRYGPFPVHEETIENDPGYFDRGREMAEAGWIGDAGAWVTDDENRVLLIRHEADPNTWGTPGGGHEPGESLEETARREVREETGLACTITGVSYAGRTTIVLASDPDERYHMLTVVFDAEYDGGSIAISDEEVLDAAWFSALPANVHDFVEEHVSPWDDH